MAEAHAILALGGNIGDVSTTMDEALRRLATTNIRLLARSADYLTPPWGKTDQPPFLNLCAEVATGLSPEGLLLACLAVEAALGRIRREKWGPRVIDIDLIFYRGADGREVKMATETLTLPHPLTLERAFVVVPLAEIAPDLILSGRRIGDVAAELLPGSGIVRLERGAGPNPTIPVPVRSIG
ncbi:MAG: 2-amino-4-hydroxy-6-hydroxymethyldihydropteridine diphosphokinase [Ancalomicrobiaceae bacterium]|nr:2-amino-4-hydroxy-6-hydroxymethyldihydropteridine diphosphokinase [Ancalomicrobiaceae bacterium]